MKRPEAKYFCNKCGYVGPNSQHENCSYFACTSLEYQYIEELERQLAERDAEIATARYENVLKYGTSHPEMYETELDCVKRQIALLREALERCAMFKLQPDTIQQITNRALAATEEKK